MSYLVILELHVTECLGVDLRGEFLTQGDHPDGTISQHGSQDWGQCWPPTAQGCCGVWGAGGDWLSWLGEGTPPTSDLCTQFSHKVMGQHLYHSLKDNTAAWCKKALTTKILQSYAKMVIKPYLCAGNSIIGKMASLYWRNPTGLWFWFNTDTPHLALKDILWNSMQSILTLHGKMYLIQRLTM